MTWCRIWLRASPPDIIEIWLGGSYRPAVLTGNIVQVRVLGDVFVANVDLDQIQSEVSGDVVEFSLGVSEQIATELRIKALIP